MFSTSTGKPTVFKDGDLVIAICKDKVHFPFKNIEKYLDMQVLDIGIYNGNRVVCLNLPHLEEGISLRALFAEAEPEIAHIAALASHLAWWRATYRHCSICGMPLREHDSERCLRCEECDENFYPVISPAIIVSVIKDGKILLAHNTRFPPGRYSLIAGFVEAGESLENAVKRELMEELGIEVKKIRYLESQPWPFPNSLMIAFTAEWKSGELKPDGIEIEQAAWYARGDKLPDLPPPGSVARRLIDGFCHSTSLSTSI
jgi:NAD+ diphosphatase